VRLGQLRWLRNALVGIRRRWLVGVFGMDIHPTAEFSLSVRFDQTNPRGVHVGEYSYIAFDVAILTHDLTRGVRLHTRIGRNCFIGARSIILPGVTIGDGSIVGAGSVVIRDVAPATVVGGNPARELRTGITVGRYGRLPTADATQTRTAAEHSLD
jgi:acetyltransferase-like isoleucine patch superfamily enzyme